jgi:hypothetical protein
MTSVRVHLSNGRSTSRGNQMTELAKHKHDQLPAIGAVVGRIIKLK